MRLAWVAAAVGLALLWGSARAADTQGDQPTFTAPSSFMRGDVLDQWCKGSTSALLTAECGDDELRALAVQRLYAFEEAKGRLNPDRQKALIADQNGWAMSYPRACGLDANVRPSLPLEPSLKNCLAKAGQARLQYLKDYGPAKPETTATPATAAPPDTPAPASFVRGDVLDPWCKGATSTLLTAECGDDTLRALAVQRLYAFEEAKARLDPDQQKALIADQNAWAMSSPQACGLNTDARPSLPLEPLLKDCLAKVGQARLQYLKDYRQPKPEAATRIPAAPATSPAPASAAPATPARSATNTPAGTQSFPTAGAPPTAPAATQNNVARQVVTATIPPAATPAQRAPGESGSAPAPHPNSSLSKIGDYTRMGAMLLAVIVLVIWAVAAWLNGRPRRAGKAAEPPP